MKRAITIGIAALIITGVTAPVAQAATPVPGRFCKSADVGKKVKTAKYGIVTCKMVGDRARWK